MDMQISSDQPADDALPFYRPHGNEIALFERAWRNRLPVLIKGPTGCGKTRFVQHMAARLGRPLYTVACHDDLSASDLVGRHLIGADGTYWSDGPLTRAVREGAICYLDEVVEARKDTTVVLHPLTDHLTVLGNPTWYARFAAQVMADPAYHKTVTRDALALPALVKVLEGINRCLPELPGDVRVERNIMGRNLLMHTCAEYERAFAEGSSLPLTSWRAAASGLIDAIVGLWRAPVTRQG